jgi:hypothetical protein
MNHLHKFTESIKVPVDVPTFEEVCDYFQPLMDDGFRIKSRPYRVDYFQKPYTELDNKNKVVSHWHRQTEKNDHYSHCLLMECKNVGGLTGMELMNRYNGWNNLLIECCDNIYNMYGIVLSHVSMDVETDKEIGCRIKLVLSCRLEA